MPSCLLRRGRQIDQRQLRLPLPGGMRCRVNRVARTRLHSLGGHSPRFGSGLRAVNGFNNRFNRGFVDADFGNRLEMRHMMPKTLEGTALLLHFWHARRRADATRTHSQAANREWLHENLALDRYRAVLGPEGISTGSRTDC